MPDEEKEQELSELEVPIEWHIPDSIVSQYATNMVVQHTEHEFIISFFDTRPPLIVGAPTKEVLEKLRSVRAECVARIVVAHARMPDFVKALEINLEKSLAKKAAQELVEE